uniref:RING-type domain-containing protein n=1 Tax=Anopheles christyi TaxID=43041 RepID=A0A182KAW9_9DIPT
MELSCSVCSELYVPSVHVVTTPCGHLFHNDCILPWLERSRTCPECRAECTATALIKVHFNVTANLERNTTLLVEKLNKLTTKLDEQVEALRKIEKRTDKCVERQSMMVDTLQLLLDEIRTQSTCIRDLENKMDDCTVGLGDFLTNMFDTSTV